MASVGNLGRSVDISGNYAIVGEYGYSTYRGRARLYERNASGFWVHKQYLYASDAWENDYFGLSVSISGETAVVGAWGHELYRGENITGAAYVFKREASGYWTQDQRLRASDPANYSYFGWDVSISGKNIAVGAHNKVDAGRTGAVYVFNDAFGIWTQTQKLSDAQATGSAEKFGVSVSINGDTIVGGSYLAPIGSYTNAGAASIFRWNAGTEAWEQDPDRLEAGDPGTNRFFGRGVATNGKGAIVGAYGWDGDFPGAAYIYKWDVKPQHKIIESDGTPQTSFGQSVNSDGEKIIVGAPFATTSVGSGRAWSYECTGEICSQHELVPDVQIGTSIGSFGEAVSIAGDYAIVGDSQTKTTPVLGGAWVFHWTGSQWDSVFSSTGSEHYGLFGKSVVTNGDFVFVGAPFEDTSSIDTGIVHVFQRSGSIWSQTWDLVGPSSATGDEYFGVSMALSGDYLVVGASGESSGTGAVYVFRNIEGTWCQVQEITASDGEPGDGFGYSVDIDGNTLIIGSIMGDSAGAGGDDVGAAYFYELQECTWTNEQKINASDYEVGTRFGESVSISGNRAFVGAAKWHSTGKAYYFEKDGGGVWDELADIEPDDGADGDVFGRAVCLSGNRALVGSEYGRNFDGVMTGAVYVYELTDQTLTATGGSSGARYGKSVDVDGNTVIVGAPLDDNAGTNAGAAYIYECSGDSCSQTQLLATGVSAEDEFGSAVAVHGNYAVVGACGDDADKGSVYVFRWDGNAWEQDGDRLIVGGAAGDHFGCAVDILGNKILVGAYQATTTVSNSGAAYIFERSGYQEDDTWLKIDDDFQADYPSSYARFGYSVALGSAPLGTVVVVGAYGHNGAEGIVYVFFDSTTPGDWSLMTPGPITASDGHSVAYFGHSVGFSDGRVLVGAPGNGTNWGDPVNWRILPSV